MDQQSDLSAQPAENSAKEKNSTASRLSVAGILALVGARLGIEVTVLPNVIKNIVTGEAKKTASNDSAITRVVKLLFSSVNQKSTYIAAGLGAAVLGFFGWTRGDRVEHPVDLLKHPFKSLKVIFGKEPVGTLEAQGNISTLPKSEEQGAGTAGNAWQKKVKAEQAVTPDGRTV